MGERGMDGGTSTQINAVKYTCVWGGMEGGRYGERGYGGREVWREGCMGGGYGGEDKYTNECCQIHLCMGKYGEREGGGMEVWR